MVVGHAPVVGEHTDEVLTGILGYFRDKVRALLDAKVVRMSGPAVTCGGTAVTDPGPVEGE